MKKTFPIILSSILAISATTNNASADLPHYDFSRDVAGRDTDIQKLSGMALSLEEIEFAIELYKPLPAKPYRLMEKEFRDAEPIILQCLKDTDKITVGSFAYCCKLALDESESNECEFMLRSAIDKHNRRIKNLTPCTPEGKGNAIEGRYVYVNGIKVCAATRCKAGSYLVRNSKGLLQGWCRVGVDPYSGPIPDEDEIDLQSPALTQTGGLPTDAPIPQTKESLENEKYCFEMGVDPANIAEMNECKKDPDAYRCTCQHNKKELKTIKNQDDVF